LANKKISFAVDRFELIEEAHNSQLAKMKFYVCRDGNNLHNLPISWETISNAAHTLIGKPILVNYKQYLDDFGSHDADQKPVGCFISEGDIQQEKDDEDNTWLTAIGYVWRKYFPEVFNVIERNEETDGTRVSMEIELVGDDNKEEITNFAFMGLTMLGKNIQPAIPNARGLLSFSAMVKETEEIVFGSGYRGIDFTIPSTVKQNSSRGLELYETNRRGGNGFSLSMARYLSNKQTIEPSRIKKLYTSLKNKSKQNLTENSDAHISFMLLGGGESLSWCRELMSNMESADSSISHFTLNTGDSTEMEENNLKKNKEEFAKEEEAVEKMAEEVEPKAEEKMAVEEVPAEEAKEEEKMAVEEKPADESEKPFAESQEEEAKEPIEEEVNETQSEEDKEEARMSLDGYADVGSTLAMLGMETETNRELASQYVSPEAGKQFSILVSEVKKLYEQNISLKEFKAGIEKQQFAHIVESTLAEVSEIMPKVKMDECRSNSANFTLENISGWQNEVKAIAFTFAKDGKLKKNDDGINRFALPWRNEVKTEEHSSVWRGQ
jgi:hypothetical protein